MRQVIDVRDMHTGIHSLYLVNKKPKTTLKAFENIVWAQEYQIDEAFDLENGWLTVEENTTLLGEVHWKYFEGDRVWIGGKLVSELFFDDGEDRYKVIGSFDLN